MQTIEFHCRKCKKSLGISYPITGERDNKVMTGIVIRCHTRKCTRVVMLKGFTEGQILDGSYCSLINQMQ